jgi:hypothetical protein
MVDESLHVPAPRGPAARRQLEDLTAAARDGALSIPVADPLLLDRIAAAHDRVNAGRRHRVRLALPTSSRGAPPSTLHGAPTPRWTNRASDPAVSS